MGPGIGQLTGVSTMTRTAPATLPVPGGAGGGGEGGGGLQGNISRAVSIARV